MSKPLYMEGPRAPRAIMESMSIANSPKIHPSNKHLKEPAIRHPEKEKEDNCVRERSSSLKSNRLFSRTSKMVLCRVTMLDASTFEVEVDKEANGSVLLEKVCTYLNIVESDYFGLTYVGAKDVKYWLSSDKKISKQLKAGCRWIFEFAVKFYPPEPTMLKEDIARYQLCLQLRVDLYNGKLPCSFMTHAILGSYTVQAELGDFDPSQDGPDSTYLKDFDFAPKQTAELFDKIADLHKSHKGQMPEEAELNFLENAKKLAMYGVDIHKAYDADGSMINLGVHASGLIIYRDKLRINRFVWPKILNLSYKRNNFYVKIRPDKSDTEHKICFKLDNDKMAKRLWKTCGEHHTFFRLKEGDQKKAATLFPRFNSRFRYSGRTQKQLKDRQDLIDKPKEVFERTYWKNKAAPYPDGQNRTAPVAGGDQAHPLDANDRRDKLGQDTATLSSGGPPPYKENDTLGRSANRPDAAGDVSEDRFDEERDRQATLELRGRGGDAAALAAGEGLTPGGDKGKKSKEDKEREKREKEEEKRRKKEEEKEKKRLEKEKKKKGNTSEDITDKMGDSTAGMNAPDAGSAGLDMGQGLQKLNTSEDRTDSDKDKEITEQFARGQDLSMGVSGGGAVKGEGDKGHKDKKKGDKDHKGKEIKDKKKEHDHDKKKGKKDKKDTVGSPKSDGEQSPRSPGSEDEKKGLKGGFFKFGSGRKGKGKDGKSKGDSSEPGSPSNMEFPGGLAKTEDSDATVCTQVVIQDTTIETKEVKKSDKKKGVKFVDDVKEDTAKEGNEEKKVSKVDVEEEIKMADAPTPNTSASLEPAQAENVGDDNIDDEVFEKETNNAPPSPVKASVNLAAVRNDRKSDTSNNHVDKSPNKSDNVEPKEMNSTDTPEAAIVSKQIEMDEEEVIQVKLITNEEMVKELDEIAQASEEKDMPGSKPNVESTEEQTNPDQAKLSKKEAKEQEKERKRLEKEKKKQEKEEKKRLQKEKKLQEKERKRLEKETKKQEKLSKGKKKDDDKQDNQEEPQVEEVVQEEQPPKPVDPMQVELASRLASRKTQSESDNEETVGDTKPTEEAMLGKSEEEENKSTAVVVTVVKEEIVDSSQAQNNENKSSEETPKMKKKKEKKKKKKEKKEKNSEETPGCFAFVRKPKHEEVHEEVVPAEDLPVEPWVEEEVKEEEVKADIVEEVKVSPKQKGVGLGWALPAFQEMKERQAAAAAKNQSSDSEKPSSPSADSLSSHSSCSEEKSEAKAPLAETSEVAGLEAGLEGNLADWPYGREGSIDRKMQFVPVEPPTTEKRDVNGLGDENTMPFFNPASLNSDNTGSLGRKTGPPVPPKGSRGSRGSGDLSEDKRFYMDGDGIRSEMPPTVQTERMKYTNDGEDIPIATTNFPIVKTETRTVTYEKDGVPAEIEDSILISSQSHSTRTQTVETTTYKTEKDGKIETRMEKRIIISEDGDDIDHDELLAEAIRSVTDMNQDLSVERIECMRQMEDVGN